MENLNATRFLHLISNTSRHPMGNLHPIRDKKDQNQAGQLIEIQRETAHPHHNGLDGRF
jgi:hypothetical protein